MTQMIECSSLNFKGKLWIFYAVTEWQIDNLELQTETVEHIIFLFRSRNAQNKRIGGCSDAVCPYAAACQTC